MCGLLARQHLPGQGVVCKAPRGGTAKTTAAAAAHTGSWAGTSHNPSDAKSLSRFQYAGMRNSAVQGDLAAVQPVYTY